MIAEKRQLVITSDLRFELEGLKCERVTFYRGNNTG